MTARLAGLYHTTPFHVPIIPVAPIDCIPPVSSSEVLKLLSNCPNKSSPLDFVPTCLLKSCRSTFSEIIAILANLSFSQGQFPSSFKLASVTPLIKKHGLDKSSPSNYRPISNLNNISKIIERLFLNRFQSFVTQSPNFNSHQSAYRPKHSTETALLSTLDKVCHSADNGSSTILVSLDYSAAFDTIDHTILLDRLKNSFGFTGNALKWLQSYLTGRSQFVKLGNFSSPPTTVISGVPQGSVLGPLLFSIYTSPIAAIASAYSVSQHQYADDTQLYIALSLHDSSVSLNNLELCLSDLYHWCCLNCLALNPDKTDAILFGTRQRASSYDITTVKVADTTVTLANKIKILGVTLDRHLTMDTHVSEVCRSAFYHIRALRHIRPVVTDDVAKSIACALVCSRLDYANSVLYGISAANIHRLQRMHNTLARVVIGPSASKFSRSSDLLRHLHWLPVEYRIKFKLAKLTFNIRNNNSAPSYLSSLLSSYVPRPGLRSSNSNLLTIPSHKLNFASRGFRIAAPTIWNSLPSEIRTCASFCAFSGQLKTFYFNSAFNQS